MCIIAACVAVHEIINTLHPDASIMGKKGGWVGGGGGCGTEQGSTHQTFPWHDIYIDIYIYIYI